MFILFSWRVKGGREGARLPCPALRILLPHFIPVGCEEVQSNTHTHSKRRCRWTNNSSLRV